MSESIDKKLQTEDDQRKEWDSQAVTEAEVYEILNYLDWARTATVSREDFDNEIYKITTKHRGFRPNTFGWDKEKGQYIFHGA